jgi:hypothetical protein
MKRATFLRQPNIMKSGTMTSGMSGTVLTEWGAQLPPENTHY